MNERDLKITREKTATVLTHPQACVVDPYICKPSGLARVAPPWFGR
jgi:hypothetical protein